MKFLEYKEKGEHQPEQDHVAAQQQAEFCEKIFRAERVVQAHQAVQQPEQRGDAERRDHILGQADMPRIAAENIETDKIREQHTGR